MKNSKFSSIASIIENGVTIDNPLTKSNILNNNFASKSTVVGADDIVPDLPVKENIPLFDTINTSPLETAKIIRGLKQSYLSHVKLPNICKDEVWNFN